MTWVIAVDRRIPRPSEVVVLRLAPARAHASLAKTVRSACSRRRMMSAGAGLAQAGRETRVRRAVSLPGDCESGGHEWEARHGQSARPCSACARAGPAEAWPRGCSSTRAGASWLREPLLLAWDGTSRVVRCGGAGGLFGSRWSGGGVLGRAVGRAAGAVARAGSQAAFASRNTGVG